MCAIPVDVLIDIGALSKQSMKNLRMLSRDMHKMCIYARKNAEAVTSLLQALERNEAHRARQQACYLPTVQQEWQAGD